MRQVTIWFWLSCKRCLKRLPFILILLVLPAASYFLREVEKEEGQEVGIAVYAGGEEALDEKSDRGAQEGRGAGEGRKAGGPQAERPLEQLLAEELTEREDGGLFCFYLCGSEEQVKEEVASGRAETGREGLQAVHPGVLRPVHGSGIPFHGGGIGGSGETV